MFFLLPIIAIANNVNTITDSLPKDTLYLKKQNKWQVEKIKKNKTTYSFVYADSLNNFLKATIPLWMVDSIFINKKLSKLKAEKKEKLIDNQPNSDSVTNNTEPLPEAIKRKKLQTSINLGFSLGHLLEYNNPSGTDKKNFNATFTFDFGLNDVAEGKRFNMTNELHWIFGVQKTGLTRTDYFQRVSDDLSTLHDWSVGLGKKKKWNINIIIKTATSVFTIYDGEYFKNYTGIGKIKGFASPYDVTIAPGIKWQPNSFFRLSVSPYSFQMYGVKDTGILNKGIFITNLDASGNYKNNLLNSLGAEINLWYDRQFKDWLFIQYRIGVSANYFNNIANNGLLDGLFITRLKLIKNIYLNHRGSLKGMLSQSPFKPYYNQTVLISYAKSL